MTFAEILPYAAAALSVVSGLAGFIWAKDGKLNAIGGMGWGLFALIGVSGGVALWQTWENSKRTDRAKLEAEAESDRADARELADASRHAMQAARARFDARGLDPSARIPGGSFYFTLPFEGEAAARPAGFVGPLPALKPGMKGRLTLLVNGIETRSVDFAPAGPQALTIRPAGEGPAYVLEPVGRGFGFRGQQEQPTEPGGWFAGAELRADSDTLDDVENPDPSELLYSLNLAPQGDAAQLIASLTGQQAFGRLTIEGPGFGREDVARILAGYRRITPYLQFLLPSPRVPDTGCEILRVNLAVVPMTPRYASPMVFELRPTASGVQQRPCIDP